MRLLLTSMALCGALAAQTPSAAHRIYQKDSASVLVLQVRSTDGQAVALGSGFVIGGGKIVTNHHVAADGQVFVEVGPARLPAKVVATDAVNDLSILEVNADLGVPALPLASAPASPGDAVYVIGAPEGFAQSISTGIVSAYRKLDGRPVLQITAPVSHGSSGSPVVDTQGMVVGVVEAFWSQGENLNFAVPVAQLRALLSGRARSSAPGLVATAEHLQKQLRAMPYSSDASSPYQALYARVESSFEQALRAAGSNVGLLHRIYADESFSNIGLAAARAEVSASATAASELDLAFALDNTDVSSNPQQEEAALSAAKASIQDLKTPEPAPFIEEGSIANELTSFGNADQAFRSALAITEPPPTTSQRREAYLGLAQADNALGRTAESATWFNKAAALGGLHAWDWVAEAKRRVPVDLAAAAADYAQAAKLGHDQISITPSYDLWLTAGNLYQAAAQPDQALSAFRNCISDGQADPKAASDVESSEVNIASILNFRHVFSAALQQATAAASANPSDAFAFDQQARADEGLQQYDAGIQAETTALSLSDGKYASMDFELGSLYFDEQNWSLALQSFQQAAEMDQTDWRATYNASLCNQRLGYYGDAISWFKQTLDRKPDAATRSEIQRELVILEGSGG